MDHAGVGSDDGGRQLFGQEPLLGIRRSDGQGVPELGDCMLHPNVALCTLMRLYPQPQTVFTPEQLGKYDGSDKTKPVYLAIDGDVYDVTASRRIYGPLGPYHVM